MTLAMVTPPAHEPLGLDDIKVHLRIDHSDEDLLLTDTLKAARQYVELASGQKLITQVWRQYETCFPADRELELKVAPVQGVVAITAFDAEGNPHVLGAEETMLVRGTDPAVLRFSDDFDSGLATNGLEIDLTVGMGDFGLDVDDALKRAILLLVAHWYEFRGAIPPAQQPVSLPAGFDNLMAPYRRLAL